MCSTNGMEGKSPRWGGEEGQILEGTNTLLSFKWVGLIEPLIS